MQRVSPLLCGAPNSAASVNMKTRYDAMRINYIGQPILKENEFDAELVEHVINRISKGKAPGLDDLTAEHLKYCHPILSPLLAKLFNYLIITGKVPRKFCESYTVPLLKGNLNSCSKSITANDFRGISISPVISKIFEHCIFNRYSDLFSTDENQFGFKKNSGCTNAIFVLRRTVESYVENCSNVNVCTLDLSKAFGLINFNGLLVNLRNEIFQPNF